MQQQPVTRKSLEELEERIDVLNREIEFLLQTDPRISTDQQYRDSIIGEKRNAIENLRDEIQVLQRGLMQAPRADTVPVPQATVSGRVTRSKAAASDASLSKVAANIQQASRQAISASRPQRVTTSTKPQLSEEQQRQSVQALLEARNWLIMRERQLDTFLDSPAAVSYPRDVFQEFLLVQSVRLLTESICDRRATTSSDIDTLRQVVKFVASRQ